MALNTSKTEVSQSTAMLLVASRGLRMSSSTRIEWTESTWNPTRGCSRASPGCRNCYAERFAHRLSGPGRPYEALTRSTPRGPRWTGEIRLVPEVLEAPLRWRKPRLVFVNSMSDLFHERIPIRFIEEVFAIMEKAHWHTFQILTKRAERLHKLYSVLPWPPNVWMGVSVETPDYAGRIQKLRDVPAAVRFLSLEPLLQPFGVLPLDGVHWVIVGGESGPYPRPMKSEWVRQVRDTCVSQRVPFFFKQWGGIAKKRAGRRLDGRTWDEMPQMPQLQLELQVG